MQITRRSFVGNTILAAAGLGLIGTMSTSAIAQPAEGASGTFEGTGHGVGGPLTVEVDAEAGALAEIRKTVFAETDGIGTAAWDRIVAEMFEHQTLEVDAVAGATLSSFAIKAAIEAAAEQGGLEALLAADAYEHVEAPQADTEVDVVVAGAGHAGLFAALCAADKGFKVMVLEKEGLVDTLEELFVKLNEALPKIHQIPVATAVAEIEAYNEATRAGAEALLALNPPRSDTGMPPVDTPPIYAIPVTVGVSATQGGLVIDEKCEVLQRGSDEPIPGLYAISLAAGGAYYQCYLSSALATLTGYGYMAGVAVAEQLG